jgi:hypothetical protein
MGRTWVLDTETKGTGAHMVPLERAKSRSSALDPVFVPRATTARTPQTAETAKPLRFKVVDLLTRQTLVEEASVREALDALQGLRSIVDVNVYTWQEHRGRWRLLTLAERRALWDLAHE